MNYPPDVKIQGNADGSAHFTIAGRPHCELFIPGTEKSTTEAHRILQLFAAEAYRKGRQDMQAEFRKTIGL